MMRTNTSLHKTLSALTLALLAGGASAQQLTPGENNPNNTTIVNEQPREKENPLLGNDIPVFDPGTNNFTFEGQTWNIENNPLLRSRYEKYLSTREADSKEDEAYRTILRDISLKLSPHYRPGNSRANLREAVGLLPKASLYKLDANLCDSISQAISTVYLARRNVDAMNDLNQILDKEAKGLRWNSEVALRDNELDKKGGNGGSSAGAAAQNPGNTAAKVTRITGYIERLAQIKAIQASNTAKMGVSEVQAKIEFQALILQLAVQRRFEHVVIATDMYNHLFRDGDSSLTVQEGSDADKILGQGLGVNPTIGTLNAFARETMRDVDEGIDAVNLLIEDRKIEAASKQLLQAFFIGEYLPKVRTLELAKKSKVYKFTHDANLLLSAMNTRDYATAANLIESMREEAPDFDYSRAKAGIVVYTNLSDAHVMSAKIAAQRGDMDKFQEDLLIAGQAWPSNPKIKEAGEQFSVAADRQIQALIDLDRLLSQNDYKAIAADAGKYAAATVDDPQKAEQVKQAVSDATKISATINTVKEIADAGNPYAAWERMQKLSVEYPDDSEVSKVAMDLTNEVSLFVDMLKRAERLEEDSQLGSSLSWFLKARNTYPRSDIANEGIDRIVDRLLPADDDDFSIGSGPKTGPNASNAPADSGLDL